LAVIAAGVGSVICCQPEAVSLVKVTRSSSVPELVHKVPVWVPVFDGPL
jgi:hypothetical protein